MIVDCLENAPTYEGMHPLFGDVFDVLREAWTAKPDAGRYEIAGDSAYFMVTDQQGKARQDSVLEAHRRYIDIHLLLAGSEEIGWRPADSCSRVSAEYNDEKDFMTFSDPPAVWIPLRPGDFAVFFPDDAHAPLASAETIRKIVVKVALEAPSP